MTGTSCTLSRTKMRVRNVEDDPHCFFFSSRRRHTRYWRDWSSDVCSSDLRVLHGWSGLRGYLLRMMKSGELWSLHLLRVSQPSKTPFMSDCKGAEATRKRK